MKLARVIGTIVSTRKVESIQDEKIMVIQPLTDEMKEDGNPVAAIDTAQAGVGDLVWWILSREASLALRNKVNPCDATITGIVDEVNIEDRGILEKEKIFIKG